MFVFTRDLRLVVKAVNIQAEQDHKYDKVTSISTDC
jgi:hypothetical protein